jgi:hypothetical protein
MSFRKRRKNKVFLSLRGKGAGANVLQIWDRYYFCLIFNLLYKFLGCGVYFPSTSVSVFYRGSSGILRDYQGISGCFPEELPKNLGRTSKELLKRSRNNMEPI